MIIRLVINRSFAVRVAFDMHPFSIIFTVTAGLPLNFWLGLLLLVAFRKALFLRKISPIVVVSVGEKSSTRVMTTAEPLRSPALMNNTNGAITHDGPIAEPIQSFDSSIFRSYLLSLLPPVLGASLEELDSIFDDEFEERVSRFAAEGGVVIYVVKVRDEVEGEFDRNRSRSHSHQLIQTTHLQHTTIN